MRLIDRIEALLVEVGEAMLVFFRAGWGKHLAAAARSLAGLGVAQMNDMGAAAEQRGNQKNKGESKHPMHPWRIRRSASSCQRAGISWWHFAADLLYCHTERANVASTSDGKGKERNAMSRFPEISPNDYSEEQNELAQQVASSRGAMRGPFVPALHSP